MENHPDYEVGMKYTIQLPVKFYDDHVSRDLPGGEEIKRNKRYVTLLANEATIEEIRDDADYYADEYGPCGKGGWDADPGLRAAAQRCKDAIDKYFQHHDAVVNATPMNKGE